MTAGETSKPNAPAGIGILGGTFDPVHLGHLHAAAAVRDALGLAEVRLIPAARPPHRSLPQASDRDRLAMVRAAVRGDPGLIADDRELLRQGKSYTIDTLIELRHESPDRPLYLILGADAFAGLPSWHRWRELGDYAQLVVVDRPGAAPARPTELRPDELAQHRDADAPPGARAGQVLFLAVPPWPIAASEIRARLGRGEAVSDLLPAAVLAYIQSHHLYQRQADGSTTT